MHEFPTKSLETINLLLLEKTILKINEALKGYTNSTLNVCYSHIYSQQNIINFVIQGDKNISLIKLGQISNTLKDIIDYDDTEEDYVSIICKENLTESEYVQRYKDTTLYTLENIQNVRGFFAKYYGYKENTDKSASTIGSSEKSRSNLSFWDKNDLEDVDLNDVIECLRTNPKVFNAFLKSPSNWDKLSQPMQEKLKEAKEITPASLTGSPKTIPVKS